MNKIRLTALVLASLAGCGIPALTSGPGQTPTPTPSPSEVPELRFAVIGDFGSGDANERAVADRMCEWRKRHPFDDVFTTGDNIYPDGSRSRFEDAFFDPMACLLDNGVEFHASLGNHDIVTNNGRPEIEEPAFGMKKRNYVVREGGVRIVLVDSNN